jgi:hypothetical protein
LTTVLSFQSEEADYNPEEYQMVNFMKLEGLWILTNLFYGDVELINVILGYQHARIAHKADFIMQENLILNQLNEMLNE